MNYFAAVKYNFLFVRIAELLRFFHQFIETGSLRACFLHSDFSRDFAILPLSIYLVPVCGELERRTPEFHAFGLSGIDTLSLSRFDCSALLLGYRT